MKFKSGSKFGYEKSPTGKTYYVVELVKVGGQPVAAHRDTAKKAGTANAIVQGLTDGTLKYDPELGHTVKAS